MIPQQCCFAHIEYTEQAGCGAKHQAAQETEMQGGLT
jgi:hypothetical protein